MISTIAFPVLQSVRPTTSWSTRLMLLVCWAVPCAPTVSHGPGFQVWAMLPAVLLVMLNFFAISAGALPEASAWIMRLVVSELVWSVWNWMWAFVMTAPCG